jgi:hypothetical protein
MKRSLKNGIQWNDILNHNMKLDNNQPAKEEQIEIVSQKEVQKQLKHLGSIRLQRGHTLWEVNMKTGMITPATYETQAADFKAAAKGIQGVRRKLISKEGCMYIPALNKKNAAKKFVQTYVEFQRARGE